MPSTYTLVHANIPEAEHLGDLYGIKQDLEEAKSLCEDAMRFEDERALDLRLISAIVASAVILYFRCFMTGSRFRLTEQIFDALEPARRNFHSHVDGIRDRFIAHPVNELEQSAVMACVRECDGVRYPAISLSPGRESILLGQSISRKMRLQIEGVLTEVAKLIAPEEAAVLKHIQGLPLDEVHAWPMLGAGTRYSRDSQQLRKRFAKPRKAPPRK